MLILRKYRLFAMIRKYYTGEKRSTKRLKKRISAIVFSLMIIGLGLQGCTFQQNTEHTTLAFGAIEELRYEEALGHFQMAIEKGENVQSIARGEGIAYLGLARYEEAIEKFLLALSYSNEFVDDFDFDTNYYLATAYFKNGQMKEAEQVYSAILALRKDREAYYLRGLTYLEQSEIEKAKTDFNLALESNKTDYDMRIEICQAFTKKGLPEDGKAYLQAALGSSEKKVSDFDKGRLSYYMEDYENARNYLEASKGTKDADTVLLLGQTYEKLGDYNYAASIYSNFLTANSENVVILNRLGMCKLEAKDAASALEYFERALALEDPSMTQVLKFNQIVAYEYLGEFDQANILMKNYLSVYPDDEDALREYEFLKSR